MNDSDIARFARPDTASLSDALDQPGLGGQCSRTKPLEHRSRMAGRAFTVLDGPAASPPGSVGDHLDDVPAGAVVVLDNGGREDATVWGDILTGSGPRDGGRLHTAALDVRLRMGGWEWGGGR